MKEIPGKIERAIQADLDAIEAEFDVLILWACESGSRAWGFPSPDSDFDARFLYVHKRDWYLSISPGRDVIERPIDEVFDVSGWDLRKALALARGGNATVNEWLRSPLVYREVAGFADSVLALAASEYQPARAFMHYRSVSERHGGLAIRGDEVRLKKVLYALRTCLAAEWVQEHGTPPPMTLTELADGTVHDAIWRARIDDWIATKAGLVEMGNYDVGIEALTWLRQRIDALADVDVAAAEPPSVAAFDAEFLRWLPPS